MNFKKLIKIMNGGKYRLRIINNETQSYRDIDILGIFLPNKKRDFVHALGVIEGYAGRFLSDSDLLDNSIDTLQIIIKNRRYAMQIEYSKMDYNNNNIISNYDHYCYFVKEIAI